VSATSTIKQVVTDAVPQRWRRKAREQLVSFSVSHVCGPRRPRLSNNEGAVTCVVKNGAFYIEAFINHYLDMGFRHIVFLDNGSTDDTLSIAKRFSDVTVLRSGLPIEAYQPLLKNYLALHSIEGGWRLDADIDEFFDYPFSTVISLKQLFEYLNQRQYTAVITQMLDMFSDAPLSTLNKVREDRLSEVYSYYDISDITRVEYHSDPLTVHYGDRNNVSNRNAALYWGGVRRTLCGNECLLTKHALFFPSKDMELFPHVHFVNNARLADFSCVLRHYKLTGNAIEMALQSKEGFPANSRVYSQLIDFVASNFTTSIKQRGAAQLKQTAELVDNGFLFASTDYLTYVSTTDDDQPLSMARS
jgi:hypothetical protein